VGRAWSRGFSGWSHRRPVWSEQERIQRPAWEWHHRAAWQKNECGGSTGSPGTERRGLGKTVRRVNMRGDGAFFGTPNLLG
jgi:hypothetical protein